MSDDRDSETDTNRSLAERVARFRSEIESALRDLVAPLATTAPDGEAILPRLIAAIHAILDAGSEGQREILRAVLDANTLVFDRGLILIARDALLVEWEARGRGGNGHAADRLSFPATGDHLPARARASGALKVAGPEGPGAAVIEALGGARPASAAACPLLVRGRPVAVIYGDSSRPAPGAAEVLGLLARIGGSALESHAQARRPRVTVEAVPESRLPARSNAPSVRSEEAGDGAPAAPEEAEMQALLGDLDPLPRRESGDSGLSPEEQRQHNDARRFASLLVSELLLYNEEAVIQGRKQRDLARRLSREIERTRQAYAARIPTGLRTAPRYLEEELLRVLADGDEALLSH